MPEVEIDIDDLLEVNSEDERAVKLQASSTFHRQIAAKNRFTMIC